MVEEGVAMAMNEERFAAAATTNSKEDMEEEVVIEAVLVEDENKVPDIKLSSSSPNNEPPALTNPVQGMESYNILNCQDQVPNKLLDEAVNPENMDSFYATITLHLSHLGFI